MTQIEMILLGIIKESPTHPYSFEKIIKQKGLDKYIKVGFSTIYSIVNKFENNGWVESNIVHQEKLVPRKVYSITKEGEQIFKEEMIKSLSQPKNLFTQFESALVFAELLSGDELKEVLSIYEAQLTRLIQEKMREITAVNSGEVLKRALLMRSLSFYQAERKWLREVMTLL
jgi:DNA-binding PadR family transcriptional regulator